MKHIARPLLRSLRSTAASPGQRAIHRLPWIQTSQSLASPASRRDTYRVRPLPSSRRNESSLTTTEPSSPPPQDNVPSFQLSFTCKPCSHRSVHRISKQGFFHGTTLVKCPSCHARHLISDHLKLFNDEKTSLEDILSKKLADGRPLSDLLKKGKLGMRQGSMIGVEGEEDIEFWEDGTETKHEKAP